MSLATTDALVSLEARARSIRRTVLTMCRGRGQGYAGQGLALADIMAALYFHEMRIDGPEAKDRFVLSTGHSAIALYATLAQRGMYTLEELSTYGMDGSRIEESPLEGLPGFEITGGSLGQGLSQAVGMAIGARIAKSTSRVYCLLSDGELQEGQVWEASLSAAQYRLDNLVVLVDNNHIQADGVTEEVMSVEPIPEKFIAFGFASKRVDAHNLGEILSAFAWARSQVGRPVALVCETIPGKGVPSFEVYKKVHYIRAPRDVWDRALEEFDG
jgi:transketolase